MTTTLSPSQARQVAQCLLAYYDIRSGDHLIAVYGQGTEANNLDAVTYWVRQQNYSEEAEVVAASTEEAISQDSFRRIVRDFEAQIGNLLEQIDDKTFPPLSGVADATGSVPTCRERWVIAIALCHLVNIGMNDAAFEACRLMMGPPNEPSFTTRLYRWMEKRGDTYQHCPSELTGPLAAALIDELRDFMGARD